MSVKYLLSVAGVMCFAGLALAQTTPVKPADATPAKPADATPPKPADHPAKPADHPAKPADHPVKAAPTKNIAETAMGTGTHTTLCALLKEAGWVEKLSDAKEKFTVMAPTDAAFKKVDAKALEALKADKKALESVLTFHVIKGHSVPAAEVAKMKVSVATVQGSTFEIKVKDGKVMVGNSKGWATVEKADVMCSNGIIHVIDAVLMPEDAKKDDTKKSEPAPKK